MLYLSAKFSPVPRAPVPAIVTLEPSLFVLGSPLFASNTRPLSIRASDVDLRSVTLTAPYLALGSAAAVLILSKNVVPVLSAMEEPTFCNLVGSVEELPALFIDAITWFAGTTVPVPLIFVVKVPSGCL